MFWSLIIGGIIGWVASLITGRDIPGGIIGNVIAGFIGAWLGTLIFGNWGQKLVVLRLYQLLSALSF
jgi:uncharacterized membrane protein YeaQ/YmgE (transglycosylase-associated protein family)